MSKLSKLKAQDTDRAKVNSFLDLIQEYDPMLRNEVLEICAKDSTARQYYVGRFAELHKELAI